jgi:uncharacterized iron-regulated membrane protein
MSETLPATPETAALGIWPRVTFVSFKQIVRTLHLWIGIALCVPMIMIGLSGSALLVQREILWLSAPPVSGAGAFRPLTEVVAAAQVTMPDFRANWIELPRSPGRPAGVQFIVANRPVRTVEVLVDPKTLKVLGSSEMVRRGPVMTFFTNIHEFLLMPSGVGLRVVGWMAVAMTFMAASGLVLWWPRKGRWLAAFLVKRGARGLRLHLDLHHAAGIWGLVIFLILSVSGIYLAFPQTVSSVARVAFPRGATEVAPLPPGFPQAWPSDADAAIAVAEAAVPDAEAVGVKLPRPPDNLLMVQMETKGLAPSIPPITVTFDTAKSKIYIDDPRHYPAADRALNVLYALHFSLGTGPLWTFVVFLSGLLPLFLAITGITIWWKKRQARRRIAALPAA